jgi:hypothetical protein
MGAYRREHIDGSISTGAYRREHTDGDGPAPSVPILGTASRIRTSTAITNKWEKKEGSPTCYSKSSMVEAIENERDSKSDLLKKL